MSAHRYDESIEEFEKEGPQEEDLTTEDHMHFYEVGGHGLVLTIKNKEGEPYAKSFMWRKIDEYMKKTNFFPNVWFISDHGNAHLMTRKSR